MIALLFLAGVLGGALNAVAGGASFVTFPAIVLSGIAPVAANASSSVALWPASLASSWVYRNDIPRSRGRLVAFSAASLLGGGLGQVGRQLLGVLATSAFAFAASYAIAWALRATIGLRVTPEEEHEGLDSSQHAETAYELTATSSIGRTS